jgi:5-methyltetrahydrofolate--homocysteine methyltransferase
MAATMVFTGTPKGFRTMMGNSPEDAAVGMEDAGADIVGTNCICGIEEAVEIVRCMAGATRLPTMAQPNAGLPQIENGRVIYLESPEAMALRLGDLLSAGARVVGGCCGTTPAHIREMAVLMGKA